MVSELERQEKGTIKLTISIPIEDVTKARENVIADTVKEADIKGFRKGKAPRKLVEEKLDLAKIQEEVLKKVLPQAYIKAVEEHKLKPIMNPKIHVEKIDEDKPWVFSALTCEAPEIDLGNYKENVQKITAKSKIILPGQEQKKEANFDEIMKALMTSTKTAIPQLMIDHETERMLSQLLDDVKRLGLTLDQYLASTNRTSENLRDEYSQRADNDLKIEFALQKIAEIEKITVDEKEIQEAILKAKDDKERANLEQNRYLLAGILRQQKTLDFLRNL